MSSTRRFHLFFQFAGVRGVLLLPAAVSRCPRYSPVARGVLLLPAVFFFANLFHHINGMNLATPRTFSEKLRLDQVTLSDIFNVYTSIFYMLISYKYKNIAVKLVAENYVFIYMVTITSHKSTRKTNRNTNN